MTSNLKDPARLLAVAMGAAVLCSVAPAQTPPAEPPAEPIPVEPEEPGDEELIVLSPFEVSADQDEGYGATQTLGGTRVRTDLRDLAASLSVVTPKFLTDTGATSNRDLLVYTTNTEVGGLFGNFAGLGNANNLDERRNLLRPSENTRVRGLNEADNARNFFRTDIPWDSYNVDRVEVQRGPNSVLFGVGSPAGIINTTTTVARLSDVAGKVEAQIAEHGSTRFVVDYNHPIIDNTLALRVIGLHKDTKYQQEPAFEKDKRVFVALNYNQQVLNADWAGPTSIKANFERGDIDANRPRILPPGDRITLFFDDPEGEINGNGRRVWDAYILENADGSISRGARNPSVGVNPAINPAGLGGVDGAVLPFYRPGEGVPFLTSQQETREGDSFGIGPDGTRDTTVDGIFYGRLQEVAGWNAYTRELHNYLTARGLESPYPLADRNYYKDKTLSDPSIFNFYDQLIDGDNKREWDDFTAYNLSLAQSFLDNRFGAEFVYDYQEHDRGTTGILNGNPYITVDINRNYLDVVPTYDRLPPPNEAYPDLATVRGGVLNPMAGSAVVGGVDVQGQNYETTTERENLRVTAYAQMYGADFFEKGSFWERLVGQHTVTGLWSRDELNTSTRNWVKFATTTEWPLQGGFPAESSVLGVAQDEREVSPVIYLSGDLRGFTTAAGLDLERINAVIAPHGTGTARRFDSHWNSTVDPAAPWTNAFGGESTQSENPANYVGWVSQPITILNADKGDIDQLYRSAQKNNELIESTAFTYQAKLFDGMIVPTYGWRRDKVRSYGAFAPQADLTLVVDPNFDLTGEDADGAFESSGNTTTWGVVLHTPRSWVKRMPYETSLSLFYNDSENFQPVNRVGYNGSQLPNPIGKSRDYGFVINTLNNRLTLKVTKYETEVQNSSLQGSALAGESYFLHDATPLGAATVAFIMAGREGLLLPEANNDWFWNYQLQDDLSSGTYTRENAPEYLLRPWTSAADRAQYLALPGVARQTAAMRDFVATLPSQEYLDALSIPIDRAKFVAAFEAWDKGQVSGQAALDAMEAALLNRWSVGSYITTNQSTTGGAVNGMFPVATIGTESKGWEFEVTARPVTGWDVTFNASKTEATRTQLGAEFASVVEEQYERWQGPSGDLRLWWGGTSAPTFRGHYNSFIYSAYQFTNELSGQQAAEIRPWRYNLVTNYAFQEGRLAGLSVGGSYRWEDKSILGYGLKDDESGLDVNKAIYGPTESHVDLWAAYQMELRRGLNWRIQVNVRNVGEEDDLVPISVDVDGTVAAQRITEGMTWFVTNTFTF